MAVITGLFNKYADGYDGLISQPGNDTAGLKSLPWKENFFFFFSSFLLRISSSRISFSSSDSDGSRALAAGLKGEPGLSRAKRGPATSPLPSSTARTGPPAPRTGVTPCRCCCCCCCCCCCWSSSDGLFLTGPPPEGSADRLLEPPTLSKGFGFKADSSSSRAKTKGFLRSGTAWC